VLVNGLAVSAEECALTRARIGKLDNLTCLQDGLICKISSYLSANAGEEYSLVTYTMLIPAAVVSETSQLLLLNTLDLGTGTRLWSKINFKTADLPPSMCTTVRVTAFNSTQYAKAVLYQLFYLTPQPLSRVSHTVTKHTVNAVER